MLFLSPSLLPPPLLQWDHFFKFEGTKDRENLLQKYGYGSGEGDGKGAEEEDEEPEEVKKEGEEGEGFEWVEGEERERFWKYSDYLAFLELAVLIIIDSCAVHKFVSFLASTETYTNILTPVSFPSPFFQQI